MTNSTSAFQCCNHTELQQLCRHVGIQVRPDEASEVMVAYLECWKEAPPLDITERPVDDWRDALIKFFHQFWTRVETQITCPARYLKDPVQPNPRPCYGCTDITVMKCVLSMDTHGNLHHVLKHKALKPK